MRKAIKVSSPNQRIQGTIVLGGSKSISNRALMIRALCPKPFEVINASVSDDTMAMERLLAQGEGVLDAGHAGTTLRFLTAYFAFKDGTQHLTGSERMQQRPIKALVDALNHLGADIRYAKHAGYPPLDIHDPKKSPGHKVQLEAGISSQYISALLMIAPTFPQGLEIQLTGTAVSEPYLKMTLNMMSYFGVTHQWKDDVITITHQEYQPRDYVVEADWSSASYYFSLAALAKEADITLKGLSRQSMQGDAAIEALAPHFGVSVTWIDDTQLRLSKSAPASISPFLEYDFINQPDIAQTVFVLCSGLGMQGLFTGLQTLHLKETDRIQACKTALAKVGVVLSKVPARFMKNDPCEFYMLEGKAEYQDTPVFETHGDHRMAMSLAPLALQHPIVIRDAEVVNKSYPGFWEDLTSIGMDVEEVAMTGETLSV